MSEKFWKYFNEIKPLLCHRAENFQKIFEYLDKVQGPVSIVETGCVRVKDNWEGDGQSTLLFDQYVSNHPVWGIVETVDLNPSATALCKELVSLNTHVHTGDSLQFLHSRHNIYDLVYLDSTDDPIHILKEFLAIQKHITSKTLVVVDDNFFKVMPNGKYQLAYGKGWQTAHYLESIGKQPYFVGHQMGWVGL